MFLKASLIMLSQPLFPHESTLVYGDKIESALQQWNMPLRAQNAKLLSLTQSLEKLNKPTDSKVIEVSVALVSPWLYHGVKQSTSKDFSPGFIWARKHIGQLRPSAEKTCFEYLLSIVDRRPEPRSLAIEAVNKSTLVAFCSVRFWDMRCKSQEDFDRLNSAHKRTIGRNLSESMIQYNVCILKINQYLVTKDFRFAREGVNARLKAVQLDPDKEAKSRSSAWVEHWDKFVSSKGF